MRIVSLLPSATEICFALGLGEELVGVTHECDYPTEALTKPKVTSSSTHEGLSSREIDILVRSQLQNEGSIYSLDAEKLEELKPDLILTQQLCTVCAVSVNTVRSIAARLSTRPRVESLEPRSIPDVFATFRRIAQMCGKVDECASRIAALESRYRMVGKLTEGLHTPRTVMLEWIDPPFLSGHWIPQIIAMAGGKNPIGEGYYGSFYRQPSREISWDEVFHARPDVLIVAACGFGVERQKQELEIIVQEMGLHGTARDSMGAPKLFICDGSHYFSRPGPRLVDTTELLGMILHPELEVEFGSKFQSGIDYEHIEYGSTTYDRYWQPEWPREA